MALPALGSNHIRFFWQALLSHKEVLWDFCTQPLHTSMSFDKSLQSRIWCSPFLHAKLLSNCAAWNEIGTGFTGNALSLCLKINWRSSVSLCSNCDDFPVLSDCTCHFIACSQFLLFFFHFEKFAWFVPISSQTLHWHQLGVYSIMHTCSFAWMNDWERSILFSW